MICEYHTLLLSVFLLFASAQGQQLLPDGSFGNQFSPLIVRPPLPVDRTSCNGAFSAYFLMHNTTFEDGEAEEIESVSEHRCFAMCTELTDFNGRQLPCSSFSYDPEEHICSISRKKVKPNGKMIKATDTPHVYYEKFCMPVSAPESCNNSIFRRYPQAILAGHAIAAKRAKTFSECAMHCVHDDSCKSVEYYHEDKECVLNTEAAIDKPEYFITEHKDKVEYFDNGCLASNKASAKKRIRAVPIEQGGESSEALLKTTEEAEATTAAPTTAKPTTAKPTTSQKPTTKTLILEEGEELATALPNGRKTRKPKRTTTTTVEPVTEEPSEQPSSAELEEVSERPRKKPTDEPPLPVLKITETESQLFTRWSDWSDCDTSSGLKFRTRVCKAQVTAKCNGQGKLIDSTKCTNKTTASSSQEEGEEEEVDEDSDWGSWTKLCDVISIIPCLGKQVRSCNGVDERCIGPSTRYCFPESCQGIQGNAQLIFQNPVDPRPFAVSPPAILPTNDPNQFNPNQNLPVFNQPQFAFQGQGGPQQFFGPTNGPQFFGPTNEPPQAGFSSFNNPIPPTGFPFPAQVQTLQQQQFQPVPQQQQFIPPAPQQQQLLPQAQLPPQPQQPQLQLVQQQVPQLQQQAPPPPQQFQQQQRINPGFVGQANSQFKSKS